MVLEIFLYPQYFLKSVLNAFGIWIYMQFEGKSIGVFWNCSIPLFIARKLQQRIEN